MFFLMLNLFCTFTLALSEVCVTPSVAVFCSSLSSCFSFMLLRYFLNYFEMDTVAAIFTVITFVFNLHISCIYITRYLYFRIFSASFLIAILSPEFITFISVDVPFFVITDYGTRLFVIWSADIRGCASLLMSILFYLGGLPARPQNPHSWRTSLSILVLLFTYGLSGLGVPTRNI